MGFPEADYFKLINPNNDYKMSPTYPNMQVIANSVSEKDLRATIKYRSKGRFISVVWRRKGTKNVLARCAQPLSGVTNKRNEKDEAYIVKLGEYAAEEPEIAQRKADGIKVPPVVIYDARPMANAVGNMATGGGWESADEFGAELVFLDIPNIHVVRESLETFRKLFSRTVMDADGRNDLQGAITSELWVVRYNSILQLVRRATSSTSWPTLVMGVVSGANQIVNAMISDHRAALVHCSDGWDRTAQLTSSSMLMMDAHFRTIQGFAVLIEKEWLSFGHKFAERYGHGKHRAKYTDKQRSPIFIQWLDCVYQIVAQFPNEFEFNSAFLSMIADHLYSCKYGTFFCDTEKERFADRELHMNTVSVWSHVLADPTPYTNPDYSPSKEVLTPSSDLYDYKLWIQYYIRWDACHFANSETDAEPIITKFVSLMDSSSLSALAGPKTGPLSTSQPSVSTASSTGTVSGRGKKGNTFKPHPPPPPPKDDYEPDDQWRVWYERQSSAIAAEYKTEEGEDNTE